MSFKGRNCIIDQPSLAIQFGWLLILSVPLACIAWTVTHEEIFREPRGVKLPE